MRKLLSVLSSTLQGGVRGGLLFLALLATTTLWAYDFQSGDLYYNFTSSSAPYTVEVTYLEEYSSENYSGLTTATIPKTVTYDGTTYCVTSIGEWAFRECSSLTSVTIPNSVTSIGEGSFSRCYSLTSITIPNSVTSIGSYAFYNCSSLTSVTIPNSITSIGYFAFRDCSSLTSVTLNSNYIVSGEYTYDSNIGTMFGLQVKEYVIGNSVTSIGSYAFYKCSKLASITIPNSVTSIGNYAFEYCRSLTSITIPNSVTSIGEWAFLYCSSLSSMIVENGNTIYDSRENCNAIIETATNTLIAGCQNTIIPNSVTSIGDYAFCDCYSITSITIPNSVTSIGNNAFSSCSALTSITIPNSVTSIGIYAFAGCYALTSITIPNSVTSIGVAAFYKCSSLASITIKSDAIVNKDHFYRDVYGNFCYGLSCIFGSQVTEYIIGDEVKGVGSRAFEGCSSLTSITIPNSVTSIGSVAFYGCSSLTSITIPNSVTSIGINAFNDCSSLTSIILTAPSVEEFCQGQGNRLLYNNTGVFCDRKIQIDDKEVTEITIPNSITSIGDYAFYSCSSLTSVTIPNSVTSIGARAFSYCSSLTSVTIPNSVTSIGNNAFSYCSSLTSVTLGGKIESIGRRAFSGCAALNEITLPASVKSIDEEAFAGCTKLYDIYCYAMEPPTAYESSFANYNAFLHVPCNNQRVYLLDVIFGNFKYIECIEAETTPTDTVVVTPSFNDAEFIWPSNSSADSYTLAISKDGEVFCTLTFNANGQLTGIAFAPSRNGQHNAPAAAQTANGFAFTVTGLDEGANYTYELLIQDRSGNTLQSYSGEFRTQSTNDCTVTVEYDAAQGQVTGAGTYLVGDTVTLTATPNDGYRFVRWSNEVEDNPYTFVISDNVTLSAEFEAVIHSDIENTTPSQQSDTHKLLRDGQLLILRDGKTYNAMGQEL